MSGREAGQVRYRSVPGRQFPQASLICGGGIKPKTPQVSRTRMTVHQKTSLGCLIELTRS